MGPRPSKIKQIYWGMRPEIKEWYLKFISSIPGKTGEFVRRGYAHRNFKSCGNNLILSNDIRIVNPQNIEAGDDLHVGEYSQISAGGGVFFGDRVMIAPFVKIWSINHRYDSIDIPIFDQGWNKDPVVIEDDVFIALGSILLPGVHVGKGSIISAGSVVGKKKIKPYSILGGNPARIIGNRLANEKKDEII